MTHIWHIALGTVLGGALAIGIAWGCLKIRGPK
jgi:hypothetical protein